MPYMTLPRGFSIEFLLLALYCALDPFGHSPIAGFPHFEVHKIDMPAWSEVPTDRDKDNSLQKSEVLFVNQVQGPESIAFDPLGRGPYTGVADGRILFWNGQSELCNPKESASPMSYFETEHICGRPLGLRFDKNTGDLYIADAYYGLMKVGPQGGLATSLATEAEGVPLRFTNDVDIDTEGNLYFTDSSTNFQRSSNVNNEFHSVGTLVLSGEASGRVLKYNLATKETTVLMRNVQFPNGISLSKDASLFVFSEGMNGRVRKYWLKGVKAGTSEILAILPGFPDNVRVNGNGDFWVAIHCRRFHAVVVKYSPEGKLLRILEDSEGKVVRAV
ncbi:Adipocyte plasma membrane-associated protein [Glycine soja]|nr:Adipocyte plasma membrane-associated protein [Glycine soja]